MSQPMISVEGRRVYIQTRYGDPCVPGLKRLGAHWDPQAKRWWITSAKQAEVEAAVAASAGGPSTEDAEEIRVVGKARYKSRNYYVRWIGQCRTGDHKARLCSLDGKLDFWVRAARPHEHQIDGNGDVARVVKTYQVPRSLASIRRYIERLKEAEQNGAGAKPDEDCYLSATGEWLVRGCAECARLGQMCRSCAFDIYDR